MDSSTKKSLQESTKQAKLLEDCTLGYWIIPMFPEPQSSKSTKPSFSHHCYMAVSPGLSSSDTSSSRRSPTCKLIIPSWVSDGRIKSPISRSWTELTHLPSKSSYVRSSYDGQVTPSGWEMSTCQTAVLWGARPGEMKAWLAAQVLQRHKVQPQAVQHQTFRTEDKASSGQTSMVCSHMQSSTLSGEREREQCLEQLAAQNTQKVVRTT